MIVGLGNPETALAVPIVGGMMVALSAGWLSRRAVFTCTSLGSIQKLGTIPARARGNPGPTGTSGPRSMNVPSSPVRTPDAGNQPIPDVSQILARSRAANPSTPELARTFAGSNDDYGTQNMQAKKE